MMHPKIFLETICKPNVDALIQDPGRIRSSFNAITSIDALGSHIWAWWLTEHINSDQDPKGDVRFIRDLCSRSNSFLIAHDVASTQKHALLNRGNIYTRTVSNSNQIYSNYEQWNDNNVWEDDDLVFYENAVVIIYAFDGKTYIAANIARRALNFLRQEIDSLGA